MRAEAQDLATAAGAGDEPAPAACAREGELLARARGGDAAAFGELYRAHGAMVHAVLLARVAPADAEDLTQEVFVSAWRGLGGLRDDGAFAGWLLQIARRRAVDWARERGRRRGRERAAARDGATETAPSEGVLAAVRELPQAYREALLMRLVAQMTGRQIALRLGMTEGSVRVHLHRGMKLLRERLSEGLR